MVFFIRVSTCTILCVCVCAFGCVWREWTSFLKDLHAFQIVRHYSTCCMKYKACWRKTCAHACWPGPWIPSHVRASQKWGPPQCHFWVRCAPCCTRQVSIWFWDFLTLVSLAGMPYALHHTTARTSSRWRAVKIRRFRLLSWSFNWYGACTSACICVSVQLLTGLPPITFGARYLQEFFAIVLVS